jgi:hypothetical protein
MAADHAPSHVLVVQFVAALLQRTLDCPTAEAHQQALQGFLDDLTIITAEKTGHYHRLKIKPGISLSHPLFG